MTKGQERKLDVAEMWILQFTLGKNEKDRVRNGTIRETIGVEKLSNELRECRLKWLGHVECREDVYVDKRVRRTVRTMKERKTEKEVEGLYYRRYGSSWGDGERCTG